MIADESRGTTAPGGLSGGKELSIIPPDAGKPAQETVPGTFSETQPEEASRIDAWHITVPVLSPAETETAKPYTPDGASGTAILKDTEPEQPFKIEEA